MFTLNSTLPASMIATHFGCSQRKGLENSVPYLLILLVNLFSNETHGQSPSSPRPPAPPRPLVAAQPVQNPSEHFAAIKREADRGDAAALLKLGKCYAGGIGVEKDVTEAFRLFQESSKAGNVSGHIELGRCYANGIGTTQNPKEAAKLFSKASGTGSPVGQYLYGKCLAYGFGVRANLTASKAMLQKSAAQAHQPAIDLLQQITIHENNQRQAAIQQRHQREWNVLEGIGFMAGVFEAMEPTPPTPEQYEAYRQDFNRIKEQDRIDRR